MEHEVSIVFCTARETCKEFEWIISFLSSRVTSLDFWYRLVTPASWLLAFGREPMWLENFWKCFWCFLWLGDLYFIAVWNCFNNLWGKVVNWKPGIEFPRHWLEGMVSIAPKRTKLQCHLGHVNRCHLAALVFFALFRFLFLLTLAIGRVPSLGIDLLICVASGEKRRSLTRT